MGMQIGLALFAVCCGIGAAAAFLRLPAAWVCDYGMTPQEQHLPQSRRMPLWGKIGLPLVCGGYLLAVFPRLAGSAVQVLCGGLLCGLLCAVLLLAAWCDAVYCILPDQLLGAAALLATLLWMTRAPVWYAQWYSPLMAAAAGFFGLWAVHAIASFAYRTEAMGFGDVKLLGVLGLMCGGAGLGAGVIIAMVCTAAVFLVLLALRRIQRRDTFPFGPFLIGGALASLAFWDVWQAAVDLYLGLFM